MQNSRNLSGIAVRLMLSLELPLHRMLVLDAPETRHNPQNARDKGDIVCSLVARQPFVAAPFPTWLDVRVRIVDGAVEKIVDVSADDGGKRHEAPIDCESRRPKGIDDQSREDAKKHSIRKPAEAGDSPQKVRVLQTDGSQLSKHEYGRRNGHAPESRHAQSLDDQVRANARDKTAEEAEHRDDGNVHQLPVCNKLITCRVIVMVPERLDIVTDVAVRVNMPILPKGGRSVGLLDSHQTNASQ